MGILRVSVNEFDTNFPAIIRPADEDELVGELGFVCESVKHAIIGRCILALVGKFGLVLDVLSGGKRFTAVIGSKGGNGFSQGAKVLRIDGSGIVVGVMRT